MVTSLHSIQGLNQVYIVKIGSDCLEVFLSFKSEPQEGAQTP